MSYFPIRGRPKVAKPFKATKIVKISPILWNYYKDNKKSGESVTAFLMRKLNIKVKK